MTSEKYRYLRGSIYLLPSGPVVRSKASGERRYTADAEASITLFAMTTLLNKRLTGLISEEATWRASSIVVTIMNGGCLIYFNIVVSPTAWVKFAIGPVSRLAVISSSLRAEQHDTKMIYIDGDESHAHYRRGDIDDMVMESMAGECGKRLRYARRQ